MLSNYVAEDRTSSSKKCVLTLDLHYRLSSEPEEARRFKILLVFSFIRAYCRRETVRNLPMASLRILFLADEDDFSAWNIFG